MAVGTPEVFIERNGASVCSDGIAVALLVEVDISEEALEICAIRREVDGPVEEVIGFAVLTTLPQQGCQQSQGLYGIRLG